MDLTPAEWAYVEERSERFTGRDWIFRGIRSFLAGPAGVLLVCGPPGSGKTAVAGRLIMSSAGRIPATGVVAGTIDATIVCRAGRVDVLDVSRRLASQLSALPEFQRQVEALAHPEVGITDVHVTAASVQAGAVVSGVHVALDRLGPERAFSAGVAAPLSRMAGAGVRPPVVLVDALDEAFVTPAARELPRLLGELVGVRLVATTRDDKPNGTARRARRIPAPAQRRATGYRRRPGIRPQRVGRQATSRSRAHPRRTDRARCGRELSLRLPRRARPRQARRLARS